MRLFRQRALHRLRAQQRDAHLRIDLDQEAAPAAVDRDGRQREHGLLDIDRHRALEPNGELPPTR